MEEHKEERSVVKEERSVAKEEWSDAYATPLDWLEGKRRYVRFVYALCGGGCGQSRPRPHSRSGADQELVVAALNWHEQEHNRREKLTRKAGLKLPMDAFVAEKELDPVEREVVELLLVAATDLNREEYKGLSIKEVVSFLAWGRPNQAQYLLPYFLPGSRLHRITGSEMADFFGSRRLKLPDEVVATLLGTDAQEEPAAPAPEPACLSADIAGFLADAGVVLGRDALEAIRVLWGSVRGQKVIREQWGFGTLKQVKTGTCLLFHGPSGTGKTLTARALARALGREPLVISYPDLLNKWFGETQKNIRDAFAEAERNGQVLVFDEADAVSARRSEGQDIDRFRNSIVNTMLMELEQFPGIVIMTTNLAGVLDPALERRIRYKVYFGTPDAEARAGIWRKHLPEKAPLAPDVDFGRLAQEFKLTGGQIANAVMTAAALAATRLESNPDRVEIAMADFEAGAKREVEGYDSVTAKEGFGFEA